jgi:hypothetical protein
MNPMPMKIFKDWNGMLHERSIDRRSKGLEHSDRSRTQLTTQTT